MKRFLKLLTLALLLSAPAIHAALEFSSESSSSPLTLAPLAENIMPTRNALLNLPPEILFKILLHLDAKDLGRLAQTSKDMRNFFSDLNLTEQALINSMGTLNFDDKMTLHKQPKITPIPCRFLAINKKDPDFIMLVEKINDMTIATGSFNGVLNLWERNPENKDWHRVVSIPAHESEITYIKQVDHNTFITSARDRNIKVWQPCAERKKWTHVVTFEGHEDDITCLAVLNKNMVISGDDEGVLKIWSRNPQTQAWHFFAMLEEYGNGEGFLDSVIDIKILNANMFITHHSSDEEKSAHVWAINRQTNAAEWLSNFDYFHITSLVVLDEHTVLTGLINGTTSVWHVDEVNQEIDIITEFPLEDENAEHNDQYYSVCSMTKLNENTIILGLEGGALQLWQRDAEELTWSHVAELNKPHGHTTDIVHINVIDQTMFLTTSQDNVTKLWYRHNQDNNDWTFIANLREPGCQNEFIARHIVPINSQTFCSHYTTPGSCVSLWNIPTTQERALCYFLLRMKKAEEKEIFLNKKWMTVYTQLPHIYQQYFQSLNINEAISDIFESLESEDSESETMDIDLADSKKCKRRNSADNGKEEMTSEEYAAWQKKQKEE